MAFRNIFVESPATVSVRREQLVIRTERETVVPLEDVNALLIESRQRTLTAALSALAVNNCAVFFCDEKHRERVKAAVPDNGSVRLLVITEKQYESIDVLIGALTEADEPYQKEQNLVL